MPQKKELDFEEAVARLEKIVEAMGNETNLERSMKLYEEGMALSKKCYERLDAYEARMLKLTKQDGNIVTTPIKDAEV
ncbi:MAG: exodeoxyribonuclease VII small subunit [Christensenellales bacterium]|jgi:exodeoxyribonuclease VII small subunit